MGLSDKSILEPDAPKPGIPVKKSTLAVLGLMALVAAGLVTTLLSSGSGASEKTVVATDPSEIRSVGTDATLREEEDEVKRRRAALPPIAPASVPHSIASAPSAPVPFPVASAPTAAPGRSAAELEQEAAVRLSKSLAHDFDDTSREVQRRDVQAAGAGREDLAAMLGRNAAASVPPSATADTSLQNDRIKQLLGQGPATRDEAAWLKEYAKEADGKRTIRGYAAAGGYVLRQGKIIPAILGRQVNSDLPGRLTAYVSSNVYDSNNNLLIPKGSTLVGAYDSQVAVGQTRLMFAFTRLILPNGYSFDLPAAQGVDMAGASGMSGDVNNHFLKMFGTSLLIAVLADRGKQPSNVTQVGATGPATAAGQVLSDVSKSILERNRVIPPTITVDQGTRINVEVVADMVFPEPYPVRHP